MGGCRCSYKSCKSATKTTENLHFFHYPVKDKERCAIWIKNADKPQFATLPMDQLRNKVVCGLHFLDKYFANIQKRRLVHNAIPTLDIGCDTIADDLSYIKEVEILPTSTDGTSFTLHADHLQPGPSTKVEKLEFEEGSMIIPVEEMQSEEVYTIDPSYIKQTVYDFNTNNVKEVVTLSGTQEHTPQTCIVTNIDNEEDCMMIYDADDLKLEVTSSSENHLNSSLRNKPACVLFQDNEDQDENDFELRSSLLAKKTKFTEITRKEFSPKGNNISTPLVINKGTVKKNNTTSIRLSNKCIIKSLKGKVPDSVLGLLSLHLYKRQTVLTKEEEIFAKTICDLPPSSRNILKKNGWLLPMK